MNEKKMKLIEAGMKLFAAKGYHTTSIQEIVTEAGISKGAFYLYFESKEDFIVTALQYFYTQISERIGIAKQENYLPQESLAHQITAFFNYIYKYKEFLIMSLRENISIGQDIDKLIHQMKMENYHWMRENIQAIYGDKINALLVDTVIQLEGLINGYFKWIVIDNVHIEKEKIGAFIVRRLDDIVEGMHMRNEEALITIDKIPEEYEAMMNRDTDELSEMLTLLQSKVARLNREYKIVGQLQEVVSALKKEVSKAKRQPIVIQGLLAHFRQLPELKKECKQIARLLDVELLE
ncbi:hypothetical protein CIL05_01345 [Virgibacillus profundi]|uniref:HTH tetR-type domain-containing protein n=1 Tax=Virgibacillus profundi TaxID=2024555 RepID=A0A2A2IJ25_9BACI|nr:TetR/AcrR family transcriptional regulator [Virgibacillus profundi]PAV31326.1 hypothetical protein CIL05_01345 [Virgibacillus profundi]PXY55511.1 TetR/AcrR family transcriptional regulator [Virgibacillus profundi]